MTVFGLPKNTYIQSRLYVVSIQESLTFRIFGEIVDVLDIKQLLHGCNFLTFKVFLGFFFVLAPATTLCIFDHVVFSQFFLECRVIKFIFTIFHRQYYIITKTLVTAFKDQPCFLGTFLYKLDDLYLRFWNPKQNIVFLSLLNPQKYFTIQSEWKFPLRINNFFLWSWSHCLGLDKAKTYFFCFLLKFLAVFLRHWLQKLNSHLMYGKNFHLFLEISQI